MDEENKKVYSPGVEHQGDFDLEDILAEYGQSRPAPEEHAQDSLADRSKRLVMEQLGAQVSAAGLSSLDDVIQDAVAQARPAPEEAPEDSAFTPLPVPEPEPGPPELSEAEEALIARLQREAEEAAAQPEVEAAELTDEDADVIIYAAPPDKAAVPDGEGGEPAETPAETETAAAAAEEEKPAREKQKKSKNRFLSPVVALLALIALRREQRSAAQPKPERRDEAERPELPPDKAARRQAVLMKHLKSRGKAAAGLTLVMIYLTYAVNTWLPLTGALKNDPRVLYLMLLILECSVIIAGLDIFTEGIMSLLRKRPTALTLVSASCLFSVLDALVLAFSKLEVGMPFCAVSALSMTFAIWGEYCNCAGLRTGFRVLTSSSNLYTVTGEKGLAEREVALLKSRQSVAGFVRRSQSRDHGDEVFGVLSPILLIACLVLGLLASLGHGAPKTVLHCVSVLTAASAAFSATLCVALPFAVGAKSLAGAGAAIAGWAGIREIGSSRHVVITDSDMFPKGTVELGNIRVLEGAFVDKVISYAGSVIVASGSGLALPFAELLRRNGYTLSKVEDFEPHDGGGMTAMVNGENVCVGNTGFMNLMSIRVPRKLSSRSAVYVAINGALTGIFQVEYRATGSVQEALVTLLHSSLEPIFAIRDFNITPLMIKTRFKMPTDSFKFPAYAERYRISGAEPDEQSRVAAAIAREGMGPLVDTAERGRRLYSGIRAGTAIAAAGCVFGLLMMFLLCWTQSFDVATAGNVITFMLLWLIPTAVIVWGIQR